MTPRTVQNHPNSTKQSGFTLVELLVVIAIIGVLAAVGTQAYTGYTASAKIKASEANFANVKNFISAELAKCSSGGALSTVQGQAAAPNCAAGTPTVAALGTHFVNYFSAANAGVKNPHRTNVSAVATPVNTVGAISITTSTTPNSIIVRAWPDPATLGTPLSASIAVE